MSGPPFGVTPTGFQKKNVTEILADIEDDQKANISASLNLLSTSVLGQLNGIVSDKLRELWDVGEAVYRGQYPDSAGGDALDGVGAITGATRLAATVSRVEITATGDPATVLTAGRVVTTGTGDRFASLADATLVAATAWTPTTAFALDDIVTNDGNIYVVVIAGTSAGAGGPGGISDGIVDDTVTWNAVGVGTAFVKTLFDAEQTGPIPATAGAVNIDHGSGTIETAVTGWDGARNLLDATPGNNLETDAQFRLRREELIRVSGAATIEAIRATVRDVSGVIQAFIFENVTLLVDVFGLPGKSFEVVVEGGLDADIASAIFLSKPAGIETFGTTTVAVIDSQGTSHDIEFSRPDDIEIFIELTVLTDASFPTGGADLVKQAIVDEGDLIDIGEDVIALKFKCVPLEVQGVVDVTAFAIGTAASPTLEDNIVIAIREIARFDTSRIIVTVT